MENSTNQNGARVTERKVQPVKEIVGISDTLKILSVVFSCVGVIGCIAEVIALLLIRSQIYNDSDMFFAYYDQLPTITISMLVTAVIYLVAGLALSAILKAFYSIVTDLNAIKESIAKGEGTNEKS